MTVTVAPMSGASLVASSTMPATVPVGLPLSTLTPCEQPPTATSAAHTIHFIRFIDIPFLISAEQDRIGGDAGADATRRR